MNKHAEEVSKLYGNKLRPRVSGICIKDNKILLVNHLGVNPENEFWAPPGGGLEFGISAEENLKREFLEETGYHINIEKFLCINEFIGIPLHTVELFFLVNIENGELIIGTEPEFKSGINIIQNVEFKDWKWIHKNKGNKLHNLLNITHSFEELITLQGYFLQKKNK